MKIHLPLIKWILTITLMIAIGLSSACSSSTTPPSTTTSAPSPTLPATTPPSTTPSSNGQPAIQITTPQSGSKFSIGAVDVTVQVSNFNLVDKLGKPNSAGEGHIHYFMDVQPPTTLGQPAVTAPGTYAASASTTYTWSNVGGGSHTFSVELVNNDHTPLVPPVTQSATLLVIPEIGPSNLVILTPRDGAEVPAGNVTISTQVSNFNLVDKLGQANASHEGHLHYFLDVDAPTAPGIPAVTAAGTYAATFVDSYTWQNVTPGKHTFSVELINNDHTPLDPPVVAKITVNVTGPTPIVTTPPPPVTSPGPSSNNQAVTVNLLAKSMAFDKSSITVRAGASVTVNFDNQDVGIPHNFAVYQNASGGQVKPIFVGDVIVGPKSIVYRFTAPASPGDYFFECDVHPQIMNGAFVVTP